MKTVQDEKKKNSNNSKVPLYRYDMKYSIRFEKPKHTQIKQKKRNEKAQQKGRKENVRIVFDIVFYKRILLRLYFRWQSTCHFDYKLVFFSYIFYPQHVCVHFLWRDDDTVFSSAAGRVQKCVPSAVGHGRAHTKLSRTEVTNDRWSPL